jgi:hypothetical protein
LAFGVWRLTFDVWRLRFDVWPGLGLGAWGLGLGTWNLGFAALEVGCKKIYPKMLFKKHLCLQIAIGSIFAVRTILPATKALMKR